MFFLRYGGIGIFVFLMTLQVVAHDSGNSLLVEKITGRGPYPARARAILGLGKNLSEEDCERIYAFLRSADYGGLSSLEVNSLKNDLTLVLMRQTHTSRQLASELAAMYRNTQFDPVWRDYCIQFLGRLYRDLSLVEKKQVNRVLEDALDNPDCGIAATALIAVRANLNEPEINQEKMLSCADRLLNLDTSPDYAKTTALQIGALTGDARFLKHADAVLEKPQSSVQLRSSALAAIGYLGSKRDLQRLQAYRDASDIRLASAAAGAMKRINEK